MDKWPLPVGIVIDLPRASRERSCHCYCSILEIFLRVQIVAMPKTRSTSSRAVVPRRGRPASRGGGRRPVPTVQTSQATQVDATTSSSSGSSSELARFLAILQEEVRQEVSRQTMRPQQDVPTAPTTTTHPSSVSSSTSVGVPGSSGVCVFYFAFIVTIYARVV